MKHRFSFCPGERAVLAAAPEPVSTAEWARRYVVVPEGPRAGEPYDAGLTPYFAGLWDVLARPWVRELAVVASPQIGKTMFAQVFMARRSVERPGPRHVAMPDQETAQDWFAKKITPLFQRSPRLRRLLSSERFAVTATELALQNGTTILARWAGSPSKRASLSALDMLMDEPDMYAEGSVAVEDFVERCRAYEHLSKVLLIGKPIGSTDQSVIWARAKAAQSRLVYEARCPACGTLQAMDFERIRVPEGERDPRRIQASRLAWYECSSCSWRWNDRIRDEAVRHGSWRETGLDRASTVSAHLPSWYSPWVSLSKVMADWFSAKGRPDKVKSWWNGHAARPYDVVVAETTEDEVARRFVVPDWPPLRLPEGTCAVTLAADMQKRDLRYSLCAHVWQGESGGREEWIVDRGRLPDFQDLGELAFNAKFRRFGDGEEFAVWRAACDSGGSRSHPEDESRTMQLYRWLLAQRPGVIFPTKGMSRKTAGVHVKFSILERFPDGRAMPRGLRLYLLDVDAFKDEILWRLTEPGAEPVQFFDGIGRDYFRELLAEKKVIEKGREVWKQIRRDNHSLDCLVGHLALAHWQWKPSLDQYFGRPSGRKPTQADAGSGVRTGIEQVAAV